MGEDSKASCLTATSTIAVAIVGASATIIAALIAVYRPGAPAVPAGGVAPAVTATSTPTPGAARNQLQDAEETPAPTPSRSRAPRIEGLYTLQGQNVSPPMQAQAEFTKVSDGAYSWRTDYTYLAYPANPFWATGELTNEDGQWMLSLQYTNEPNAMPYNIPVSVNFSNNVLVIAINNNQGITWRKR
jgi:hypothetical protein